MKSEINIYVVGYSAVCRRFGVLSSYIRFEGY